jgi:ATP-dependent Lhr-like helicase
MTFLCEDPEAVLQAVALVELAREGWVETGGLPEERCWPVLVHQLLALTLQFGAISAETVLGAALAASLTSVPSRAPSSTRRSST